MVIANPSDWGDYNLKRFQSAKSQARDNITLLLFDNIMYPQRDRKFMWVIK